MSKKKSQIEAALQKATIELLLLKLLDEDDMYGYQLAQEFTKMNQFHGRNEHEKIFIRTFTHRIDFLKQQKT